MTTTTGDPSSLKTPSSLSGGDLVSRLLAATPPYLYNVPLTPHSFFFSEMLRSFVQAKASSSSEAPPATTPSSSAVANNLSNNRRRKRSWRDARERPLELTKDKSVLNDSKYFHQELSPENNRYRSAAAAAAAAAAAEYEEKNQGQNIEEKNQNQFEPLKPVDENRDFLKNRHFFDDPSRLFNNNNINNNSNNNNSNSEENLEENRKESGLGFAEGEKNSKLDFKNQNYTLPATNSEFTPSPFWYPPYPIPPQYPGIDPLHFFIDLRVSGHIWDRKVNSERQPIFKNKHCSAFSVPQTAKEYNRPLNLTRDEAGACKNKENYRGTHFIFKNLTKTYRDIESKSNREKCDSKNDEAVGSSSQQDRERASPSTFKEDNEDVSSGTTGSKKDIRALIGLELVVDYVKEPKEEPQPQSPTNNI
ncbi:putative uncharacterized protein DDB_G0282133 isoform X2 [Cotesia glomerata]|uniref:Uncharacterized protein n=2 Tax=Cotesia glomerata TaxID=32391 RepID=A0AAV7HW85_COTGL|nr:putative uncharacterized protein DDB_G0282133 isoform X2 [Cotesia glomerata]XP_044587354.1 putative uncharacterized protein DDB_G0282133 isoform X2 [Cotesia glomerata]KAH0534289.1 hypothetical protein KQX54_002648 [Cotesia glomerata]